MIGSHLRSKAAKAGAARTDPPVPDLANAIEKAYPEHVIGVKMSMIDAAGRVATDADILLQNVVI
jgi:hypothetical protein